MPYLDTMVGLSAAFCTTISNVPQTLKAWNTQSTADLSLNTILLLFLGLSLWITYGLFKADFVIVIANSISLLLIGTLLLIKVRHLRDDRKLNTPTIGQRGGSTGSAETEGGELGQRIAEFVVERRDESWTVLFDGTLFGPCSTELRAFELAAASAEKALTRGLRARIRKYDFSGASCVVWTVSRPFSAK